MLFVPLPLFATLFLGLLCGRFIWVRDMALRSHQLFAALLGLYALQSLFSTLRWGYDVTWAAGLMAMLAPILPVIAYLAYRGLTRRQIGWGYWPLGVIGLNWAVFFTLPDLADALILMTYLGFGGMLLRLTAHGPDQMIFSPFNNARDIVFAMGLTGLALIASGLTDVYLIYDFIQNQGRNAGLVLTFVQTGFVLVIGGAALFARSGGQSETETNDPVDMDAAQNGPTDQDVTIIAKLETLFAQDGLHKTEDLSLRRLSRRLGVPDRQVSNAINRARGISVSQFVNNHRIQDACEMLIKTEKSVIDISLAAGFASKSNFNREFLRVTQTTPSRWRSQNRVQNMDK